MYSTCRAVPPGDAAAQALFKALLTWPSKEFSEYKRQLDSLRAKPIDGLSAAEAEAYFLLLRRLEIQVLMVRGGSAESRWAVVLEGRQHGIPIAQRFRDDSFVRCAFFDSEAWILNVHGLRDRFGDQERLAHDAGLQAGSRSPTEFSIGHNVSSKPEVDAVMEQAKRAGAVIVKAAHDTFWGGYAGYFQDRDAHLWEVAWNPHWVVQE